MKFRNLIRSITSPLPPAAQGPVGSRADQAWAAQPEPSILETLFGWGSDGKRYELPPADARRLRPILLPDLRAERNRKIAEQRRAAYARGERDPAPVSFAVDAPQQAPGTAPPQYDFMDSQPDMSPEAKSILSGVQTRKWGPGHSDVPPKR